VDTDENVSGFVEKLLLSALDLSLADLALAVRQRGGLVIPAHVDRRSFSCMSQLGYVPPGPYQGLELLHNNTSMGQLRYQATAPAEQHPLAALGDQAFRELTDTLSAASLVPGMAWHQAMLQDQALPIALCANSDAHYPHDIGQRRTLFWAEAPSFEGLGLALERGWTVPCWLSTSY
jgi:hypothetical protein